MIKVQFMKPFYTKVSGNILRLVFAYQYFSIEKDDELYHFVPVEGKEMLIDLHTKQVENLSDVFVFQRGNRFIRLPLYQLLLVSNIEKHLNPILSKHGDIEININNEEKFSVEYEQLFDELEKENIKWAIDYALQVRNEEMFYELCNKL